MSLTRYPSVIQSQAGNQAGHAAPAISGSGLARMALFLDADTGQKFWDYIFTYDIFNPTEFAFLITSFSDGQSATQRIGAGQWKASGGVNFTMGYQNGPPDSAQITVVGTAGGGFPLTVVSPFTSAATTALINYPAAVGDQITFTLSAVLGAENPTSQETVTFINDRFWGITTKASGYLESDVEGLASSELSNAIAKSFTVTAGAGQYIAYAHRAALGTATFQVGQFEGGFEAAETVSVTNPAGFVENYKIYRSTNANLGSTSVTVS